MTEMDILNKIDPQNMRSMVTYFPALLNEIKIGTDVKETVMEFKRKVINGLCFVGMGGSSIAGSYVSAIRGPRAKIPIIIERNYTIPNYINKDWIVIAVSYSGNTEETLSSLKTGLNRGLRTICITSNGEMGRMGCKTVLLPKRLQPRAAFPIFFSVLLSISEMILGDESTDIDELSRNLTSKASEWGKIIPKPMDTARLLEKRIPLFIGAGHIAPVAYRAKCQMNENSKHLAFSSEIPEANHNEVEGFGYPSMDLILPIFLRGNHELSRIEKRLAVTYDLYNELKLNPLTIKMGSQSVIEEMLALTHYLDMVSVELAEIKGVNPITADRISDLKQRLADTS